MVSLLKKDAKSSFRKSYVGLCWLIICYAHLDESACVINVLVERGLKSFPNLSAITVKQENNSVIFLRATST